MGAGDRDLEIAPTTAVAIRRLLLHGMPRGSWLVRVTHRYYEDSVCWRYCREAGEKGGFQAVAAIGGALRGFRFRRGERRERRGGQGVNKGDCR